MATTTNKVEDRKDMNKNIGSSGDKGGDYGSEAKDFGDKSFGEKAFGEKGMQDAEGVKDNVKSFVAGKAKSAMESVGVDNWQDVKDRAGQALQKGKELATDVAGRVGDGASAAVEQVSTTVKRYPFQAVLIGFGVGALIGALLSGSRRSV